MKYIKYWAAAALLCGVSAVSFVGGRQYEAYYYNFDNLFEEHQKLKEKYDTVFEDACHMSDLIRCYKDHLYDEESVIKDYNCFDELEGLFLNDDPLDSRGTKTDLSKYVWAW